MKFHSIRFRLTLWYLAALTGSCIVLFGSFYYVTAQILKSQTDREISNHAQTIVRLVTDQTTGVHITFPKEQLSFEFAQMPGMLVAVSDDSGKQLTTSQPVDSGMEVLKDTLEKSANIIKPTFVDRKIGSLSMRLGIFPVIKDGSTVNLVLVAHPTDVITRSLNSLIKILIFLILAVGIPAGLAGYLIARAALMPLSKLKQRLDEVSSTNLNQSLPNPGTRDEIEHLTATFNSMLARLDESFNRERRFIGDVAHELKTPLATLKSSIEVALSKKRDCEELESTLSGNLDVVDRLSSTINDVLDLAMSQSGEIESQFVHVNLSELINEAEEMLKNLATSKKIRVLSEIEDEIYVRGSPKKLFRAIYNLADNAVKYTPVHGKIALSLRRVKESAAFEISNTGRGISQKDLPLVFKRFYRTDVDTPDAGSGLGLSICKSIVETHHGEISILSTPGKITTFTVRIPATPKSS